MRTGNIGRHECGLTPGSICTYPALMQQKAAKGGGVGT